MTPPLVVIPNYSTEPKDVGVVLAAIESVRKTTVGDCEVLLVDDCSPDQTLVDAIEAEAGRLEFEVHRKDKNSGFSKTVNIGLRRALQAEQDAVLMNADIEIQSKNWIHNFRAVRDERGRPAAVVGALLLFPNGLIQHAGIYFSLHSRTFDHLYKYAPGNLPEALKQRTCPVTGALQFIRHETLATVGVYDEQFSMGWEDVDYCIRVMLEEQSCVYTPKVRAFHYEMMFRGKKSEKVRDWQDKSFLYLVLKYQNQSFSGLVPNW